MHFTSAIHLGKIKICKTLFKNPKYFTFVNWAFLVAWNLELWRSRIKFFSIWQTFVCAVMSTTSELIINYPTNVRNNNDVNKKAVLHSFFACACSSSERMNAVNISDMLFAQSIYVHGQTETECHIHCASAYAFCVEPQRTSDSTRAISSVHKMFICIRKSLKSWHSDTELRILNTFLC